MMAPAAGTVPTAAERIRSACIRAHALVAAAGAEPATAAFCHLLADGTVAIVVAERDPMVTQLRGAGEQALLELIDRAPLRLRERVRALVWVSGHLRRVPAQEVGAVLDRIAAEDPNPVLLQVQSPRSRATGGDDSARYTLLRLKVESVVLADATGAESVAIGELVAARPDPFCTVEAGWLRHLDAMHPEIVARLAAKLSPSMRRGPVRPLGVDRYGVWLRIEDPRGDHDVRLPFTRPAEDVPGLNRAVRMLVGCPFLNGLHARRR